MEGNNNWTNKQCHRYTNYTMVKSNSWSL